MDNKTTGKIVASGVIGGGRYVCQKRIGNTVLGSKRIGKISEDQKTTGKPKDPFIVH